MAKKMQKLFAMLLIGTVTLSATSLSALALDVDVALGDVTISSVTDESGSTTVSHTAANENGTTEKRTYTLGENESVYVTQSGEAPTGNTITVESGVQGVDLVLKNVNIKAEKGESAVAIGTDASANITVSGENTLVGGTNGAGIAVSGDATLNLSGDGDGGTLTAIGNAGQNGTGSGAGIGGTKGNGTSGTINIDSLHGLTAEGYGIHASGIGSALDGSSGAITIKGSTIDKVTGGFEEDELQSKYGESDPEGGAAIGGGGKGGNCGNITIENSTISSAHGGSKATAIGGSCWADVGNITITDSVLKNVVGGSSSAGIGVARMSTKKNDSAHNADANITITGSTVKVTGGEYGAGIGTGYNGDSVGNKNQDDKLASTKITIEDSNVTAIGGNGGAGIGGGYKGWNTDITIQGGTVVATGGILEEKDKRTENGASAIGTGANGSGKFEGGTIAIDGNATVIAVSNGGKWAIDLSCDVSHVASAYQNMFLTVTEETTYSGDQEKRTDDKCETADYENGFIVIMDGKEVRVPGNYLCAAVTINGTDEKIFSIGIDSAGKPHYYSYYGTHENQDDYAVEIDHLGEAGTDMKAGGSTLASRSFLNVALRAGDEVPDEDPGTDPGTDPDPDPGTDPDEDTPTIDIPDGDAPLTDIPTTDIPTTDIPTTDIPDEDEPLTDIPTTDIPDEDVPLSDIPKTGDISALWLALAALSGTGLAGVSLLGRKKQDEE